MSPTIAIAEDEEGLRDAVAEYLADHDMRVLTAANADEFRAITQAETIDVAILDIAMPGETGLSLARWLRAKGPRPGIIFATAAGASHDRILGIELGADDYIVKPYELRELLARIKSVLRRLPEDFIHVKADETPTTAPPPAFHIGPFSLDLGNGRLIRNGLEAATLSSKEIDLFLVFARRPNRLLTRAQLLDLARARDADTSGRSIDVRIARLRAKVEPAPDQPKFIRTIRGEGYMFVPDHA